MHRLLSRLIDKTVYYSFDRSGFLRHRQFFDEDLSTLDLKGRVALVTGGTSGIGLACVDFLSRQGCHVIATGRSRVKGEQALAPYSDCSFMTMDMGDWDAVKKGIHQSPELDFLVLNAGGMPKDFQLNTHGIEAQMASQLFGHALFLHELDRAQKLKPEARVVWVSSGGMYLKKLGLKKIFEDSKYDKVSTYANVKRAQVIYNQELAKTKLGQKYIINCMHPGWVETPGVKTAIPGFWEKTKHRLRTPQQGADTILWLLLSQKVRRSGGFYFDREPKDPYPFFWTRENKETREKLIQLVEKYISV